MLIKPADDRTPDLQALQALAARPDVQSDLRSRIEQEIRNIQSGIRGEQEAAYEIEFHYGQSRNWMSIHDLRLECAGRVAQIDHLLINRVLEVYVCESKRFAEGVAINEQGEFTAFHNKRAYGVPSPLEQNRRHIAVLESVFKSGQVPPPKRLGLTIKPTLIGLVLVSKTARISRPKAKLDGLDAVLKNDQLKARIDKVIDADNNPLGFAKLIGIRHARGICPGTRERAPSDPHRLAGEVRAAGTVAGFPAVPASCHNNLHADRRGHLPWPAPDRPSV